jgi:hypothetical protein
VDVNIYLPFAGRGAEWAQQFAGRWREQEAPNAVKNGPNRVVRQSYVLVSKLLQCHHIATDRRHTRRIDASLTRLRTVDDVAARHPSEHRNWNCDVERLDELSHRGVNDRDETVTFGYIGEVIPVKLRSRHP